MTRTEKDLKKLKVADLRSILLSQGINDGELTGVLKQGLIDMVLELDSAGGSTVPDGDSGPDAASEQPAPAVAPSPAPVPAPAPAPALAPGQDTEAAERLSLQRNLHPLLKRFMASSVHERAKALREGGNDYPSMWQDVDSWRDGKGWRNIYKTYLEITEVGGDAALFPQAPKEDHPERAKQDTPAAKEETAPDAQNEVEERPAKKARKSRWGSAAPASDTATSGTPSASASASASEPSAQPAAQPAKKERGRSRWGKATVNTTPAVTTPATTNTAAPTFAPPAHMQARPSQMKPEAMQELVSLQSKLKTILTKITTVAADAKRVSSLPFDHPDRSPSPPPIYDQLTGQKKNTREKRWKDKLEDQKMDCLERMADIQKENGGSAVGGVGGGPVPMGANLAGFGVGAGFKKRKKTTKVFLNVKDFPGYNFIGLVIGPRGKTQKELEAKTGAKVAIRGKGSVKEGSRGRRDGRPMPDADLPLHVLLTAEDQSSLDMAEAEIRKLVDNPMEDKDNEHKQKQLRELAVLNGTLKEDEFCPLCAQRGHRAFECPSR